MGKHANRNYSENLSVLKSMTLEERREKIAVNFAKKILKNSEHRKMFNISEGNTRSRKRVIIPNTRTARYERSTIPSLGKIINQKLAHKL